MKNQLFFEKYRPKTLDDIVLLPRIRKIVENELEMNYLLSGPFGCGKTSLIEILAKDYPTLTINASKDTSIEILRTKIDMFCKTVPMFEKKSDIKIVFLDEIDGVSAEFQEAFKKFIEEYSASVRFIANTNYLHKVSGGIMSRFLHLDFVNKNAEEEKYIKTEFCKRLANHILPNENIELNKEQIVKLVNRCYPDFRTTLNRVQEIKLSGNLDVVENTISNKIKEELFEMCLSSKISYDVTYHFINDNFGADNIGELIKILGRTFIHWIMINRKDIINLCVDINYLVTKYDSIKKDVTDPLILGITIVTQIQKLCN